MGGLQLNIVQNHKAAILKVTPQVLGHWSFEFIFKAKLKLQSGNQKIQYGCQAAILKLMLLKINRLLLIYISTVPLKFIVHIQSQTKVRVWKPKKSNMAARWPFWNYRRWKSIGSYPYTGALCHWSLELIFTAKLKLESGNQKIQYGHQAAILKVASLKINRLLPMTTINMHMKFEMEIPKQTWLTLRKPCRLQSPETKKSNMAARRPFWKWCRWKSKGSYPYT